MVEINTPPRIRTATMTLCKQELRTTIKAEKLVKHKKDYIPPLNQMVVYTLQIKSLPTYGLGLKQLRGKIKYTIEPC